MKRFVITIILAGMLSGAVMAGDMQTPGAPSPQTSNSLGTTVVLAIISLVVR